jgi:hypothetical protein
MHKDQHHGHDPDYGDDDESGYGGCNTCGGVGYIIVCIDDMCRGAGECMHGDGEIPCPDCDEGL